MNPTKPDPNNPLDAAPLRVESLARVTGTSRGERWFRSLVQNSSDVVMILEADGTVRYVSPAVERVLGYRPEEMVGSLAFDHVHPEDIDHMSKSLTETLEKPGVQPPVEYRVRAADGSWRYMEAIRSNWLGDPHIAGVVANVRDITERKEVEEALRRSESSLATAQRIAHLGNWDYDITKDHASWSDEMYRIFGFAPRQFAPRYRTFLNSVHPEDRDLIRRSVRKALYEEKQGSVDYRVVRPDGDIRVVQSRYEVVRDVSGRAVKLAGTVQDITERKKAEEALKESEERYRTLMEQSVEAIYLYDAETKRILESNAAFRRMMGYSEEELLGMRIYDFIAHADEDIDQHVGRSLKEKRRQIGERRYRRKDGSVILVDTSASVISYGGRTALCAVSRDVTERREAEEAVRRSEIRLTEAQRLAHLGGWEWDVVSGETRWSDQTFRIYGYEPKEFVPTLDKLMEVVHPDDRQLLREKIDGALYGGEPYDFEHRIVRPDGTQRVVHRRAEVVFDDEGGPLRMVGTVQDITERKQAEERIKASEAELRALFAAMNDVILVLDSEGRYLKVVPTNPALLYRPPEDLVGKTVHEVFPQERADQFLDSVQRALAGQQTVNIEYSLPIGEQEACFAASVSPMLEDQVIIVVRDITERKRAEQALKESEERYRTVVEEQTELVCRFSPDLTLTFVNDAYCRYFGQSSEELVGSSFMEHIPDEDRVYYEAELARLSKENPTRTVEHRVLTADGEVRWQQWTDTAVFDDEGRIIEYQSVGRDVTERRALEERLEHRAFHDPLTDLPNRQLLLDRLGHALARTRRRRDSGVAVLFMDLDGFKVVNDSLGHEIGDRLLVAVAERLKGCLRPEDTLARFAGDEFIVLLEEVDGADDVLRVTQRITEEFLGPFVLDGRELVVRLSIGIALGDAHTKSPEGLLRDADAAMYRAKQDAVDYRVFDPQMHEQALSRMELENDLRQAVERGEFAVHYQPKFRLGQPDRIVGVEALVRWEHPQKGLMLPDDFIPVAEETGLIISIGGWVMKEACRQAKEWQERYPSEAPLSVCANLSASQVRHPGLLNDVRSALSESGLEPGSLILEITEGTLLKDTRVIETIFRELKALGVRLAIDDFGKEYSSLSYLNRLPVDGLKIDSSFVQSLGEDPTNTTIVEAVISLAHSLGLEVTGEGVESAEQLEHLIRMGCDLVQGYHLARPLPSEEVEQLLADHFTEPQQDRRNSGE